MDVLLNGLTEVTDDYVTEFNWRDITDVIIPEGVTRIGEYAFENCFNLRNIMISDSVTSIGKDAFYGCRNLMRVMLGNNIKCIEKCAFRNCLKIPKLTFKGKTLDEVKAIEGYPWEFINFEQMVYKSPEICYNIYVTNQ